MGCRYCFRMVLLPSLLALAISCGTKGNEDGVSKVEIAIEENGAKAATIEFDKDFVDLGNISHGEVVAYTFNFTNSGTEGLIIKDLIPDCGCTNVTLSKKVLNPGEEASLEVVFNSRGWYGSQYKSVSIVSNASTPSRSVTIKVNVI